MNFDKSKWVINKYEVDLEKDHISIDYRFITHNPYITITLKDMEVVDKEVFEAMKLRIKELEDMMQPRPLTDADRKRILSEFGIEEADV